MGGRAGREEEREAQGGSVRPGFGPGSRGGEIKQGAEQGSAISRSGCWRNHPDPDSTASW